MDDNFDLFQMKLDNPVQVTIDSNSIFFESATHLSKIETTCQPYKKLLISHLHYGCFKARIYKDADQRTDFLVT